jgi:hypothetical protein
MEKAKICFPIESYSGGSSLPQFLSVIARAISCLYVVVVMLLLAFEGTMSLSWSCSCSRAQDDYPSVTSLLRRDLVASSLTSC